MNLNINSNSPKETFSKIKNINTFPFSPEYPAQLQQDFIGGRFAFPSKIL
jgi:hypothetical protein